MEVSLIFKIAAVGILVSVLGQVLKQSGRDEQAFLLGLVGLVIVFIIVYPIILSFTLNSQIKKMYKSNKRINMLEETLTFYDEFLESKSDHNYCKVQYTDIYRVCETKSNFYIFISDNQAFIIIKSELKDVDGFKDFIIDKAPYKKYR